jgi:tetratricopeptide (TPR) repeat protein
MDLFIWLAYSQPIRSIVEAEKFYKRAIEVLPGNIEAMREYALFLHKMGRYRDALRYAKKLAQDADDMYVELLIGDCYLKLDEKEEALRAYEKGIAMYNERIGFSFTDQNTDYLRNLLSLYEENGQQEKAKALRDKFDLQ